MQKHILKVEKRKVTGKKVKNLRKEGLIPANIYGKKTEPTAVQVNLKDFEAVYKQTGASGLVELQLGEEKRPVLIHEVQRDFISQAPVHADFYQVNLREKVKTMIPVTLLGEPKAVSEKLGIVLQTLNEIEVEALPTDLPEHIDINIEHLAEVDQQVTVADIAKMNGVEILTPAEEMVAKIAPLVSEEAAEQAAEEAAASEEAKTEGEAAAEGEVKAAEENAKEEATEAKE